MESILQGWLTKSPPEKKQFKLFGSKWRKRYFVLYAPPTTDDILDSRSVLLEYYTSKKLHHKCGTINLADCEEVLSSLDSEIYRYVFGLRTQHKGNSRTYYLAADTEPEMNKWVNKLCQVLGLTENDELGIPSQLHQKVQRMATQPIRIQPDARQQFQRPVTHQPQSRAFATSALLSPAPPPMRPTPGAPSTPFTRLNISEPNLLDVSSPKSNPENRQEIVDTSRQVASPPGSSRIRNAESVPELDRFSPTARKPGSAPGEGREFMELPPIPPQKTGQKTSNEPQTDIDYDLPKQKYYESHERAEPTRLDRSFDQFNSPPSSTGYKHMGSDSSSGGRMRDADGGWYNAPSTSSPKHVVGLTPKNGTRMMTVEKEDECYNVPPNHFSLVSDECYNVPKTNFSSNQQTMDDNWNWNNDGSNSEADRESCYNVPKSQLDKRKHASQGEEFYNIPKSQTGNWQDFYDIPQQKSDRRSYGGQGWLSQDRSYQFGQSIEMEEDYDIPKSNLMMMPERKDETVYNIPGHQDLNVEGDSYNRPQCFWESKPAQLPYNTKHPVTNQNHKQTISNYQIGLNQNTYNVPPSEDSAHLHPPTKPPRPYYRPSPDREIVASDDPANQVSAMQAEDDVKRGKSEEDSGSSSEVRKTGTFKQNKSVQSSSSIHKKQAAAAGAVPIHDSIRFTQRTKSFKRSLPSQDRSTLPLPVKRIVERSESSSSSCSEDEK